MDGRGGVELSDAPLKDNSNLPELLLDMFYTLQFCMLLSPEEFDVNSKDNVQGDSMIENLFLKRSC